MQVVAPLVLHYGMGRHHLLGAAFTANDWHMRHAHGIHAVGIGRLLHPKMHGFIMIMYIPFVAIHSFSNRYWTRGRCLLGRARSNFGCLQTCSW